MSLQVQYFDLMFNTGSHTDLHSTISVCDNLKFQEIFILKKWSYELGHMVCKIKILSFFTYKTVSDMRCHDESAKQCGKPTVLNTCKNVFPVKFGSVPHKRSLPLYFG